MCSAVRCSACGKTTWRGCGRHVDQVLAKVPVNRRCTCPPKERRSLFSRFGSLVRGTGKAS